MRLPLAVQAWASRRLANPAFQRWATRLPLTRPIARRRARDLFGLAAGFVGSQLLAACLRVGLLDALRDGPRPLAALAAELDLDADRLARLVDAAAPLGLLARHGERVVLGSLGAAVLGNPAARAMIEHHDGFYRELAEPERWLRAGTAAPDGVAALWSYAGRSDPERLDPQRVAAYSTLMTRSQALVADEILAAVPLASRHRLLDVGGGEGAFVAAALECHAHLSATVFDLPGVCEGARRYLERRGVGARARVQPGSFLSGALPPGADVISLVRVVHDHDDPAVLTLLRAARAALPADGLLVIAEPLAGVDASVDAYFGAYFMAMGQGRLRTPAALAKLLTEAGFRRVQQTRTRMPLLTGVVTARAPGAEVTAPKGCR
ncbi:MAG: methyltransferase [Pseudomonadales bacterium]